MDQSTTKLLSKGYQSSIHKRRVHKTTHIDQEQNHRHGCWEVLLAWANNWRQNLWKFYILALLIIMYGFVQFMLLCTHASDLITTILGGYMWKVPDEQQETPKLIWSSPSNYSSAKDLVPSWDGFNWPYAWNH